MEKLIGNIHVNIPFSMLYESYIDVFVSNKINPEIGFDAEALDSYTHVEYKGIADRIHSSGLSISMHAPFMDLSPGSPDPMVRGITRHRFSQFLSLIPLFRPKSAVFHTGYDKRRYWATWDNWIENSVIMWKMTAEALKKNGVFLMLENVYENEPEKILVLLEELRPFDVGFCFDTGHQSVFSELSLHKWLETLGPFIGQLHLHDNKGQNDDHLALGEGNIAFPLLFDYLVKSGDRSPLVTLEPHKEEDLLPSLEYLEKIWPW